MAETATASTPGAVPAAAAPAGPLFGILAEFEDAPQVLAAARKARDAGYTRMDAYTPFPVEGLSDALGQRCVAVPWIMFATGVLGAVGGFLFLTWATTQAYPINIGGRPLFSWPVFIPITFEITVLSTAIVGLVAMFALNGLPRPHHPLFGASQFHRACTDRFFLCIEATDPKFEPAAVRAFLESLAPESVEEVADTKGWKD